MVREAVIYIPKKFFIVQTFVIDKKTIEHSFIGKSFKLIQKEIMSSFTAKGIVAPLAYFTGTVWVNMNVKLDEGYNINFTQSPI